MLSSALTAAFPDMADELAPLRPIPEIPVAADVKPAEAGEDVKMDGGLA
jgi:hypothetical protein